MVIVHTELKFGGSETYYLRIAKECQNQNKNFTLILFKENFNQQLYLKFIRAGAVIIFYHNLSRLSKFFTKLFPVSVPSKNEIIKKLLLGEDVIYTANSLSFALAIKLNKINNNKSKILVGFHHSMEFTWVNKSKSNISSHEKQIRNIIFKQLPKENLLLYDNSTKKRVENLTGLSLNGVKTFPYGVVFDYHKKLPNFYFTKPFKIISVGRLVSFKTYNFWMIEVVKSLKEAGHEVVYHIYGEGPERDLIQKKIKKHNLSKEISLLGEFDYDLLSETISRYDLFIGSGTTIIEAASLGIPSIVGSESLEEAVSYGFLHECYNYDFNLKDLDLPQRPVIEIITKILKSEKEYYKRIGELELMASKEFLMRKCLQNIESSGEIQNVSFNTISYDLSRRLESILLKTGLKRNYHTEKYNYSNE